MDAQVSQHKRPARRLTPGGAASGTQDFTQEFTGIHMDSLGLTRIHSDPQGLTGTRRDSQDSQGCPARSHNDSQDSIPYTRIHFVHKNSQGLTGIERLPHKGSQRSIGIHRDSQRLAGIHRDSQGLKGIHRWTIDARGHGQRDDRHRGARPAGRLTPGGAGFTRH